MDIKKVIMIDPNITEEIIKYKLNAFGDRSSNFASTRDVFNARLQGYASQTEKWLEAAVIGEIGNNTFDHNFQFIPEYPRGVYFDCSYQNEYIVIADYGMGILASLSRVRPEIQSEVDSVEVALTQRISGRYPEQRGNGLKFVMDSVKSNKWSLFYQSGTGCCNADGDGYYFSISDISLPGTLAILHF